MQYSYFIKMNNDTLSCIFDYIHLGDILNCYLVCKHYHHVANYELKWKSLFTDEFSIIKNPVIANYQIEYKRYYELDRFLAKTIKKSIIECIDMFSLTLSYGGLQSIPAHAFSVTRYARRIYMRFLCGNLKRMYMRRA